MADRSERTHEAIARHEEANPGYRPGERPMSAGWKREAACLNADPDIFHPAGQGSPDSYLAYRICDVCPVVDLCLDEALSQPPSEDYGVWGLTSWRQRRRIRAGEVTVRQVRADNRDKAGL